MGMEIDIFGTLINVPEPGEKDYVETWGTDIPREQYWRRKPLPDFFEIVNKDKNGNVQYTEEQVKFAYQEIMRCLHGFYFMNKGVVTYVTGKYYFYLQWWMLEDDIYANYREADRRYFLFLNHWEHVPWCLGIFRGKKRREGASSQACSNLMYECIFYESTHAGLVSKTKDDSKDTFTEMVSHGFKNLPPFLQPKQINKEDTVSQFLFAEKSETEKAGYFATNKKRGYKKLNFKAPVLNAYDRGRLNRLLADEGGKWPVDIPFSKFISIVKNVLVKGGIRVGFCEAPSTVNEMEKAGGKQFKICWTNADQNDKKFRGKKTGNKFVTYFSPAYEGFEGFVDRYGKSIIGPPTEDEYQDLVELYEGKDLMITPEELRMGALAFIKAQRDAEDDIEEAIRQYPFTVKEMFMAAGNHCEFNQQNIEAQIDDLKDEPRFLRRCRLNIIRKVRKSPVPGVKDIKTLEVEFIDDKKGGWLLFEEPLKKTIYSDGEYIEPKHKHLYQIGVDTTKDDFAVKGSKPTILVMKRSRIIAGEETGMYPVALYDDKTRLDIHFDEEVLKACMWYSCTANYELDAGTGYWRTFKKKLASRMLEWTPVIARDPVNPKPLKPGTQSGNPFQLAAQLQVAKMYVDGTGQLVYNGHVHRIVFISLLEQLIEYDHSDRTKSDQVIALMMALLPLFGDSTDGLTEEEVPEEFLPTYKIESYA